MSTEYVSADLEVNTGSARGKGAVIKAGNGWVAQINTPYGWKTKRSKSQRVTQEWLNKCVAIWKRVPILYC